MSHPIVERLKRDDNLPSLPAIAVQLLGMTENEDVSITDMARVIEQDPALALKILRVVNSSLFGMPRQISSMERATVILGIRTLRVMALGFSLVDTLSKHRPEGFDYTAYWRRSLTTAVAGRMFAEKISRGLADTAFTGGMLCDIGILAGCQWGGPEYEEVVHRQAADNGLFQEIEQRLLGLTHETISAELLAFWGLPKDICTTVAGHHGPLDRIDAPDAVGRSTIQIVRAAAMVAELFCGNRDPEELESIKQRICECLDFPMDELDKALESLDTHIRDTAKLFVLDIGRTRSYADIQMEASLKLARLFQTSGRGAAVAAVRQETQTNRRKMPCATGKSNRR